MRSIWIGVVMLWTCRDKPSVRWFQLLSRANFNKNHLPKGQRRARIAGSRP